MENRFGVTRWLNRHGYVTSFQFPLPLTVLSLPFLQTKILLEWRVQVLVPHVCMCLPACAHILSSTPCYWLILPMILPISHCRAARLLLWFRLDLLTVWAYSSRKTFHLPSEFFIYFFLKPSISLFLVALSLLSIYNLWNCFLNAMSLGRFVFEGFLTWRGHTTNRWILSMSPWARKTL